MVRVPDSVRHLADLELDLISGYDRHDPTSLLDGSRTRIHALLSERGTNGPLRIGVPVEFNIAELDGLVRRTWLQTLERLSSQGHSLHLVSVPSTRQALSAYYVLAPSEASSNLARFDGVRYGCRAGQDDEQDGILYASTRDEGFGAEVKRRIVLGAYSLSAEAIDNYFVQAQRVRRTVQRDFDAIFALPNALHDDGRAVQDGSGVDVLICPTAPSQAPVLSSLEGQRPLDAYTTDVLTVPASLAGLPAVSVPVQLSACTGDEASGTGPSIGMQVIGQYGDDALVLEVAERIEELGAVY